VGGVTSIDRLPDWVTLVRAPNPGPMTLDGTNTWVLRAPGAEYATVIDPGPLDEGHLARVAAHGPVQFILVTHGHLDHVEGAARLSELLGGAPVRTADPDLGVGGDPLAHDEMLGGNGVEVRVLDTPGHTLDSVCFLIDCGDEQAMFTGDTILGRGSTVVAYPDGDLGSYLASLQRLSAYENVPLLPGHGPALADCAAVARAYLDHRRERLDQVRSAVAAGAETPDAVVDRVYADIDPAVRFAAIASTRAQLDYLRRESQPGSEQLDPL
jgi:glyoxylase-like metal-dependent hydrolase (beta-lactamase superfamily II)